MPRLIGLSGYGMVLLGSFAEFSGAMLALFTRSGLTLFFCFCFLDVLMFMANHDIVYCPTAGPRIAGYF